MHKFVITMIIAFVGSAIAQSTSIDVLAQPREEWTLMERYIPEFEAAYGVKVNLTYLSENERRSRSRLDASSGAGQFDVYYIDDANVAEFGAAGWLVPLRDYYPEEFDIEGFSPALVGLLSYNGVNYGAPFMTEGDMMFYRKDLLEANDLDVPTTLEEYLEVVKALHDPPRMYGTATRGLRGSGMNVWRFSPYLKMFGGSFFDEAGNPVFNSPEAVQAVEYYIELIKHSPSPTMSWSDAMDAFAAGRVGIVTFANLKMDTLMNPNSSVVVDLMGYGLPPAGPAGRVSSLSAHGLALSAVADMTDDERQAAANFIGWFTSQQSELRKVEGGQGLTNARTATFESQEFADAYPAEYGEAMRGMLQIQELTIAQIPQWNEIGDYLGIKLEELFTSAFSNQPYNIQAALDDAVAFAAEALNR